MDFSQMEKALFPYEKELLAQEKLRQRLGVKEVERPTYERYITGTIDRFDRRKNAFMIMLPNSPFGKDIRERIIARTHYDFYSILPYGEMEPINRIGQSLTQATWRVCREYHPVVLPVTPQKDRVEINDRARTARLIKKFGLFLGAEMVRITELDQRWVYKDVDIPHRYAILVVVSHVKSFYDTGPSHWSAAATGQVYSRLKFITSQLADFISGLGYDAAYRETLGMNPELLMVPLAIDAGVGEFARTGQCLSPEFGINMRIKAVTTDLPLEVDKPISFGVHDFCMACEICAKYCPANAIPYGPPQEDSIDIYNNPGFSKWYLNAEKCMTFWNSNKEKWANCGRCLAVCPWNKPINIRHKAVRRIADRSRAPVRKMLAKANRTVHGSTKRI